MTEQEWISIRDKPEISMSAWFEFYKEKGGMLASINEFVEAFSSLLWNEGIVTGSDGRPKHVNLATATQAIHKYYNNKFGL